MAARRATNEAWRGLRVGDRIRIVRLPSGIDAPGYVFPRETRRCFERLIAGRRAHRVAMIDDGGLPWIWTRSVDRWGRTIWESLAVNDDSWVRAKRTTTKSRRSRK